MSNDDRATLPVPSTYQEADALLHGLPSTTVEAIWSSLSEEEAKALLRSLAPPPESAEAQPQEPVSAPVPPEAPDQTDSAWEKQEASESSPLPRLSEKTLLDVLETAPDAIVVIDRRGVIVQVNAQTEKMFGYHRQELEGKKVEILVPIRNREKHVQDRRGFFKEPYIRAMGEKGKPLFGLRKDGREFPVEISLSPLKTDQGILVTSTIRNVTEGKMREAQLRKAEARYLPVKTGLRLAAKAS